LNITRTRVVLGAAAAGGLLLACNAILGIEEATPRLDGDASPPVNDVVGEDRATPGVDGAVDTGSDVVVTTDAGDAGAVDASDAAVTDGGDPGGPTITKIYAGTNGACAIFSNGVAKCWGRWAWGLGAGFVDGGAFLSEKPTKVAVAEGVRSITEFWGGGMCALTNAGLVLCWGPNAKNQLGRGNNNAPDRAEIGVAVREATSDGGSKDLQGADELADTCVLRGGAALCWGRTDEGQSGQPFNADGVNAAVPVLFVDGGATRGLSNLRSVSDNVRIANDSNGYLVGWGRALGVNKAGAGDCPGDACRLADFVGGPGLKVQGRLAEMGSPRSETYPHLTPGDVSYDGGGRSPVTHLGAALIGDASDLASWGAHNLAINTMPSPPRTVLSMAQTMDTDGDDNARMTRCFATTDGIFCHGRNRACQAGLQNQPEDVDLFNEVPSTAPNALRSVRQLVAGAGFFCALTQADQVFCWGSNRTAALGRKVDLLSSSARLAPVRTQPGIPGTDAATPHPADCRAAPVENLTPN